MVITLVMALGLALLAWFAPRAFVGVGLILVVLSSVLRLALPSASVNLLDEIVIVVALVVLIARRAWARKLPVIPAWSLWFAGFFAVGLFSSLINNVPTTIAIEGAFLAIKAVLFGLAVAQIDWRPGDLKPFVTGGAVTIIVIFLASVINFANPDWWTALVLGETTSFPGQLGLQSLIGPFEHPAALGRMCAMLAIATLTYRICVQATWRSAVLLGMATAPALLSFRVKTLVSMVVAFVAIGALNLKRISKPILIVAAVLAVVLAVPVYFYVAADITQYIVNRSARSLITLGSLEIAAREFPLGVGFGRYGSYTASVNYSPEYVRLGFETVYGLRSTPGEGQYLNDTQWPALLGETGWLGAALYAGGLIHMGVSLLRGTTQLATPLVAWVRLMGIGWLVILIVESVGAPVFTSAPAYPLPFVAAGIFFALQARGSADSAPELAKPRFVAAA